MLSLYHLDRLGPALRRLRTAARFTQTEVCERTGLLAPQLSRWENGHEVPTLESLVRFLSAVGAGLSDLERLLLGKTGDAAMDRELQRILAGHRQRIAARPRLRRQVEEIVRDGSLGLERILPRREVRRGR